MLDVVEGIAETGNGVTFSRLLALFTLYHEVMARLGVCMYSSTVWQAAGLDGMQRTDRSR